MDDALDAFAAYAPYVHAPAARGGVARSSARRGANVLKRCGARDARIEARIATNERD